MSEHRTCRHPDRDCPKMMCGYPLPCPHHTAIIDSEMVHIPLHSDALKSPTRERIGAIGRALEPKPKAPKKRGRSALARKEPGRG